jgi:Tfp pilus assembly protein PilN
VITKLNLASNPFRSRTLPYVLAVVLLFVSVAASLLCIWRLRQNSDMNEIALRTNREMQTEITRLNGEGEKVQQQLSPDQQTLLIASHRLVANKTFSWSRLFADLESVLPGGVSASRISVNNVFKDGDSTKAELDLSVLSRDYQSVITMIDAMNSSRLFQAELRGQDLQKNERVVYTEYTLHLIYSPASGYPAASNGDLAQAGGNAQ